MAQIHNLPIQLQNGTWVGIFLEPWIRHSERIGWHAGIVFQDQGTTPVWMHLEDNLRALKRNGPPSQGWYVDLELNPLEAFALIAWLRLVLINSDRRVRYGFSDSVRSWFDDDGRFVPGDSGEGLTCASFVIAVLKAGGIDLLDFETWPTRANQDQEPKQRYVDTVNQHYSVLSDEEKIHFDSLCQLSPSARCLLRELFGAACVSQKRLREGSIRFKHAARNGRVLAKCVNSGYPNGPEF